MSSPLLTRSMSSLARCRCSSHPTALRSFSTTPCQSAIGPENPKFIKVPIPPQPQAGQTPKIKGTLPAPRDVYPVFSGLETLKKYLAAVTPEPQHKRNSTDDEYVEWKRRLASSRRENLREGLTELRKRKSKQHKQVAGQSKAKNDLRQSLLSAPQREDERLTNPTITSANSILQHGALPDPGRDIRIAAKTARVQANEASREIARRDALHTLYMNARSFITTEAQLNTEIDNIFVDDPYKTGMKDGNIWDVGAPPTVRTMLSEVNNTQKSAIAFHASPAVITGKRMKKVAEELTGGKLD